MNRTLDDLQTISIASQNLSEIGFNKLLRAWKKLNSRKTSQDKFKTLNLLKKVLKRFLRF